MLALLAGTLLLGLGGCGSAPLAAAAILAASSAVKVLAAPVLWILIRHH
jgi:hypothetical protein